MRRSSKGMALLYVFKNLLNDCLNETTGLSDLLLCSKCWKMLFGLKSVKNTQLHTDT